MLLLYKPQRGLSKLSDSTPQPTPHRPHKLTVVKYGPMNAPMDGNINPTVGSKKIIQSRLSKGWSPFALSLRVPDCVLIHPHILHLTLNKNSCLIFHGSWYIRLSNGHKILKMNFYTKLKKTALVSYIRAKNLLV